MELSHSVWEVVRVDEMMLSAIVVLLLFLWGLLLAYAACGWDSRCLIGRVFFGPLLFQRVGRLAQDTRCSGWFRCSVEVKSHASKVFFWPCVCFFVLGIATVLGMSLLS